VSVSISKTLEKARYRQWSKYGYAVTFRRKRDRDDFPFVQLYLYKSRYSQLKNARWHVGDSVTGASLCKGSTRKKATDLMRRIMKEWETYRLIFACRLNNANTKGPSEWGTTPVQFSDEFIALLVTAKIEGVSGTTVLKDIYASKANN
jgi:hypothetical protein